MRPGRLDPDSVEIPEPETWEAVIHDGASSSEDLVTVVVESFSPDHAWDPMQWVPVVDHVGVFYPKRGDRAIVVRPEGGPPAIAVWFPSTDAPDHPF